MRPLESVRRATAKATAAADARDEAIRAAAAAGFSTRQIAEAAGLSHQRVHQIVRS